MSSQEVAGALASGGRYRATSYMVELLDTAGVVTATFDVNDISSVQRTGQTVTLKRRNGGDVTITTATLDDAGRLEAMLRPAASVAATPVKTGGGFGKFLKWGCLGTLGLIALIVVIAVATSSGGDDDDDDDTSSGSAPTVAATSSGATATDDAPTTTAASNVPAATSTSEAPAATEPPANSGERLQAGQSKQIGDAEVTFNGARVAEAEFLPPKDGFQYIAAEFKIVNTGSNEYTLSSLLQFEMYDSDSRQYNVTIGPEVNGSLDGTIPAGGTLLGEVVFEVPIDKAPYVVRFQKALFPDLAEWTVPQP